MVSYEARILCIEEGDARIYYIVDPNTYFSVSLSSIYFQGHSCNHEVFRKDSNLRVCDNRVSIDEEKTQIVIKHGRITGYNESENNVKIKRFSDKFMITCSTEFVFLEDRKVIAQLLRAYSEFPVEIFYINASYAKVKIITNIPRKISAIILDFSENSIRLGERKDITTCFEVDPSQCFEKFGVKSLSLEQLAKCIEQECEIGIYMSSCRVELKNNIVRQSIEEQRIAPRGHEYPVILDKARISLSDLLPLDFNGEIRQELWYRCGFNFCSNIRLALLVGLLEIVLSDGNSEMFQSVNSCLGSLPYEGHSRLMQMLSDARSQCFLDKDTLNYGSFYRLLDRFRVDLEKTADIIIPCVGNRVLFNEITDRFAVCINIYEVLGNKVLNTLYAPKLSDIIVPVVHLLIKENYAWTIYSKNHMENAGFSLVNADQGDYIQRNKYNNWPVRYYSPSVLEKKYVSLASNIVNLDKKVKESLKTRDKVSYQHGLEIIINELKIHTEEIEDNNKELMGSCINKLQDTANKYSEGMKKILDEVKEEIKRCFKCKKNRGNLKICNNCDNFCHSCAISSKINGNCCSICRGQIIIPQEAQFKCQKCEISFHQDNMLTFHCDCLFCYNCYMKEIDQRDNIERCRQHSSNKMPIGNPYQNIKCNCGGEGKYKVCDSCPIFCDKCLVKCKQNRGYCIRCSKILALENKGYYIKCQTCTTAFKLEAIYNLSCGCVYCKKCLSTSRYFDNGGYKCRTCKKAVR